MNNPKAFPSKTKATNDPDHKGMTLRDYFAAKAMQAMQASPELMQIITSEEVKDKTYLDKIAIKAYDQADSMLKARL